MRVLHVVTYISLNSEFGGPSQVALNILSELNKSEHCEIIALSNSKTILNLSGSSITDAHLFREFRVLKRLGFAGIINFRIFLRFFRIRKNFDLVHIHLARDLVTLPISFMCLILGKPYILQTHGMIDPSKLRIASVLDLLLTRRVLRGSLRILSLSEEEDIDLRSVEKEIVIERFLNAASKTTETIRENKVSFVGRLSHDKRPDLLVRAALILLQTNHEISFEFVGPDGGLLKECTKIVSEGVFEDRFKFLGPLSNSDTIKQLSNSQILVLPSPRDRFPLAVIEALSAGTPVVITAGNGLAELVTEYHAGEVTDLSELSISIAISKVLDNFHEYQVNSRKLFDEVFEISANVNKLREIYTKSLLNSRI